MKLLDTSHHHSDLIIRTNCSLHSLLFLLHRNSYLYSYTPSIQLYKLRIASSNI